MTASTNQVLYISFVKLLFISVIILHLLLLFPINVSSARVSAALPCRTPPPDAPLGGWDWYEFDRSRYRCGPGLQWETGEYPYWISDCGADKIWNPKVIPSCERKYKKMVIYNMFKSPYLILCFCGILG